MLRRAGVGGPYALVLGPYLYDQVFATTEEGYPLAKRIEQQLVDRPIIRAEGVRGAAVVSLRGGDYELTVGQDLSIGYAYHEGRGRALHHRVLHVPRARAERGGDDRGLGCREALKLR